MGCAVGGSVPIDMATIAHLRLLSSLDLGDGGGGGDDNDRIMIRAVLRFLEVTDCSFPPQVNPEFKDNTVEPKGEVSRSNTAAEKNTAPRLCLAATDINFTFYDSGHAKGNANSL